MTDKQRLHADLNCPTCGAQVDVPDTGDIPDGEDWTCDCGAEGTMVAFTDGTMKPIIYDDDDREDPREVGYP